MHYELKCLKYDRQNLGLMPGTPVKTCCSRRRRRRDSCLLIQEETFSESFVKAARDHPDVVSFTFGLWWRA